MVLRGWSWLAVYQWCTSGRRARHRVLRRRRMVLASGRTVTGLLRRTASRNRDGPRWAPVRDGVSHPPAHAAAATDLAQRIRDGDPGALEILFHEHYAALCRF